MVWRVTIIALLAILRVTDGQQSKKFFRKDYTYLPNSNSFYKIHPIYRTWMEAKEICEMEGASLFYSENKSEADEVRAYWNQSHPFYWTYIWVSNLIAKHVFETTDGRPISDVYNNWSPGKPNNTNGNQNCVILRRDGTLNDDWCNRKYPFICKKSLAALEWNKECDMPNADYVYNADLGRCYKFHLNPKNWNQAAKHCSAEQSYLSIIDSQSEADYLTQLTASANKDSVGGNYLRGAVHLGFHNGLHGWQTIKGTPLLDSGYSKWGGGQPDGEDREKCGSMFYEGTLNDIGCDFKCFFICEHDIGTLSDDDYNDGFGDDY